jgi:hypothetical protein
MKSETSSVRMWPIRCTYIAAASASCTWTPQDVVLSHDSSPLSINGLAICQQAHTCLNGLDFSFGLTHDQPKTVAINRQVIAFQSSAIFW